MMKHAEVAEGRKRARRKRRHIVVKIHGCGDKGVVKVMKGR